MDLGRWSRGQARVPRALPKGAAPHPRRPGCQMGSPRWGWQLSSGPWRAHRPRPGQSSVDKGAANTCRSWLGLRFSQPKRLQLPTVTGIKLRGPDGGLREPGGGWGGGLREGGAEEGREGARDK